MKLQEQESRTRGKTTYTKYVITIPTDLIKSLNWRKGTELDARSKDGKLIIKRKKYSI